MSAILLTPYGLPFLALLTFYLTRDFWMKRKKRPPERYLDEK